MTKNFLSKIENSYIVPSSIMIGSGNEPTDIRQICDTVEDFQEIADLGMELRYDGLITYEQLTGRWKGCKRVGDSFEWITINPTPEELGLDNYAKKDHTHVEYLPEVSDEQPEFSRPIGHVWLESN
jgi:hypothetical protein|nr:MAG TPA: hypothetical protein [Caudoviricetes sp.]